MENDYDKYSQGTLPADTTKTPWYNSMFSAAGTIGGAYFNSIAPQQVADDSNNNTKNTTIIVLVGVVVIAAIIYFVSKKSK